MTGTDTDPTPAPAAPADPAFSEDQAAALALLSDALAGAGVDLEARTAVREDPDETARPPARVVAVLGKAGSGKTHLLADLVARLLEAGARQVGSEADPRRPGQGSGQGPGRRRRKKAKGPEPATFAVVAPTNKAASVLRARGVAASTIHRIIYSPIYDPDYEALAEWLAEPGDAEPPAAIPGVGPEVLARARAAALKTGSPAAALASVGLRGGDFITGWKRRDDALSIGLVDEASMLDAHALEDLTAIFDLVALFGDPAQLAPVGAAGEMVFDALPKRDVRALSRVHRQTADNPILDLAYALQEDISFQAFEDMVRAAAARDARVTLAPRLDPDLMGRAPALVWRNATRVRIISAFRVAHGLDPDALSPGEPLICDGLELSAEHRNKRIDLEQAGLVKGAQAFWLQAGRRPGFAQIYVAGAPQPRFGVAAIIHIERPGETEPFVPSAARQGAVFVHGAACTIHKSQGSQWETVQVFAPDLFAAARAGRVEAGAPLWRRLAYVAITRAQERLLWVTRYAIARPTRPLEIEDLVEGPLL